MDDMLDEKGIEVVGGLLSLSLSEVLLLKGVSLGEEARFAGEPRDDAEEAIIEFQRIGSQPTNQAKPLYHSTSRTRTHQTDYRSSIHQSHP